MDEQFTFDYPKWGRGLHGMLVLLGHLYSCEKTHSVDFVSATDNRSGELIVAGRIDEAVYAVLSIAEAFQALDLIKRVTSAEGAMQHIVAIIPLLELTASYQQKQALGRAGVRMQ